MGFIPAMNFLSWAYFLNNTSQDNFLANTKVVSRNLLPFIVMVKSGSITTNKGYKISLSIDTRDLQRVSTVLCF